jgi:hypothetical protein
MQHELECFAFSTHPGHHNLSLQLVVSNAQVTMKYLASTCVIIHESKKSRLMSGKV